MVPITRSKKNGLGINYVSNYFTIYFVPSGLQYLKKAFKVFFHFYCLRVRLAKLALGDYEVAAKRSLV